MTVKIDNVIKKIQFKIVRNTKNLNTTNILTELAKVNNFKEEEEATDVERITNGILEKLNTVARKLAPSKRVQVKNSNQIDIKNSGYLEQHLQRILQRDDDWEDSDLEPEESDFIVSAKKAEVGSGIFGEC